MKKKSILTVAFIITISMSNINAQTTSTFKDQRDGKTYQTVKIGKQVWMAENLSYKASRNCWAYKDDESNVTKYGYLYYWETAKTVCPSGWHLPTKAEFDTLLYNYGGRSDIKANYTALIPNGESGFSASFGGWRGSYSNYNFVGEVGYFWSSTARDDALAWTLSIGTKSKKAGMSSYDKSWGSSVRCLMDN